MSWRAAWRLSEAPYTEITFQAIYALRQGNLPPPSEIGVDLVDRARRRVWQSKLLVSLVLALVASGAYVVLQPAAETLLGSGLPEPLYDGGALTGVLLLELTLLWWTGLQVLPTFLGASILPTLESLPIPERTLDRTAFLVLLRLFDAPALTCLILTPLAVGEAFHSPWAGIAILPGIAAVVLLALGLSLATGRFFVTRVQGSRGGRGRAGVRWAYMVLWAIPAFAMYGFVTFALQFFAGLKTVLVSGPPALLQVTLFSFPFPFALLPSVAAGGVGFANGVVPADPLSVGLGIALYAVPLGLLAAWLPGAPRRLARSVASASAPFKDADARLDTVSPWYAVLRKDLRVASRTPGYAFLLLLPLMDAVAIGAWTYVVNAASASAFNLGVAAVTTAALLATFFGPAFFAIEVMGYSYARSLPLPARSLLFGKVSLISLLYLIAAALVLGITLFRVFDPAVFAAFVVAEFPAVVAAAVFELGILLRRAERKGLPIVNLYAGGWWAVAVAVPGLLIASAPIVVFSDLKDGSPTFALLAMATASLVALVLVLPLALSLPSRRRE